jgi:hypothetical protein
MMVRPLAICLEDPAAPAEGERYLRCVAVPGRQAGLRVDAAGRVLWRDDAGTACELWVSGDEKLILYRPDGGGRVVVRRAGRELDVPCGKPVVLLDQDRFEVGGRTLRVHVHGPASAVAEPSYLPPRAPGRGLSRAATAIALGAALGAAGCKPGKKPQAEVSPEVEVRTQPPDMAPLPEDAAADTAPAGEAGETIELRTEPPEIAVRPLPAVDAGTPAADGATGPADAEPATPDVEPAPADAARANPPIEVRVAPPDMPAPDK